MTGTSEPVTRSKNLRSIPACRGFNTLHHSLLEFPAGHLAGIQLAGQLISGDLRIWQTCKPVGRPGSGEVAAVKNSMGCGGFFLLATGATPGIWLFALTVIIMSAFPAGKAIAPFLLRDELKAHGLHLPLINPVLSV